MAKRQFKIDSPRWVKTAKALREGAFELGLDLEIRSEKHWFREAIFGTVSGDDYKVSVFMRALKETIEDYND